VVVRRERLAGDLLGRDHRQVRDLLADLVERPPCLGLDVPPRGSQQLLALLGRVGLGLVGQRVGRLAGAGRDVLGLLARLAESGAILVEQLVGLALRAFRVLDRLLDRLASALEGLGDAREDELVEDQQRRAEQEQRPDHQPQAGADQEAAAAVLLAAASASRLLRKEEEGADVAYQLHL
jgi:hypothetical protein